MSYYINWNLFLENKKKIPFNSNQLIKFCKVDRFFIGILFTGQDTWMFQLNWESLFAMLFLQATFSTNCNRFFPPELVSCTPHLPAAHPGNWSVFEDSTLTVFSNPPLLLHVYTSGIFN